MSKIETGGPAFPCEVGPVGDGYTLQTGHQQWMQSGMTLRDHFAGLAMQGRMAGNMAWQELDFKPINGLNVIENEGVLAYRIADAMIKARTFE